MQWCSRSFLTPFWLKFIWYDTACKTHLTQVTYVICTLSQGMCLNAYDKIIIKDTYSTLNYLKILNNKLMTSIMATYMHN